MILEEEKGRKEERKKDGFVLSLHVNTLLLFYVSST